MNDATGPPAIASREELLTFYTAVLRDRVPPTGDRHPPVATISERMRAAAALDDMLVTPKRGRDQPTSLRLEMEAAARRGT